MITTRLSRRMGAIGLIAALILPITPLIAEQTRSVSTSPSDSNQARVHIETETVTVTRTTASPATITRKPGPFFLHLKTEVRDPGLNLSLVSVSVMSDTSKLANALDLPRLRRKTRSAGLVDLPPGTYHLQVLPEGKTICTITIAD